MTIADFILIVALLNFVLAFMVVKSDSRKHLNQYFGLSAFMMGFWVLLNYFFSKYNSALILKIIYAHAPFMINATLTWISLLKKDNVSLRMNIFNLITFPINVIFSIIFFTDPTIINNVTSYANYQTGAMFNYYMFYMGFMFSSLAGYMIYQYIKAEKRMKSQVLTILIGLAIIIFVASLVGYILPTLGYSQFNLLDSASSIFFVTAGGYSVIKNKFLDVRTFATEVISYLILIIMLILLFIAKEDTGFPVKITLFVFLLYGVYTLIKSVRHEIKQKDDLETLAKKLDEANHHLEELDEAKDNFLSMAAHELNTPIAAIEGYLSMVLDEKMAGPVNGKIKDYLDNVYNSSKRLAALVKDLLNVSRIESNRIHLIYAEIQIEDVINEAIKEVKIKADEVGHKLTFKEPKHKLPKTWMDQARIMEIIINIIGNSIKYTDPPGKIVVEAHADDNKIVVSVEDNGRGIPKDRAEHVFEKFSQVDVLKDQVKGTGLGMFITKNLIELHNGKLWFKSHVGADHGTIFYFSLPILKAKPFDPHENEGALIRSKDPASAKNIAGLALKKEKDSEAPVDATEKLVQKVTPSPSDQGAEDSNVTLVERPESLTQADIDTKSSGSAVENTAHAKTNSKA